MSERQNGGDPLESALRGHGVTPEGAPAFALSEDLSLLWANGKARERLGGDTLEEPLRAAIQDASHRLSTDESIGLDLPGAPWEGEAYRLSRFSVPQSGAVLLIAADPAQSAAEPVADAPAVDEARPLRFTWASDAQGCIVSLSAEAGTALGVRPEELEGRGWSALAADLRLDPSGELGRALGRRDTWSGIAVTWPLPDRRVQKVELAALPVFDRERAFLGFRGFGVLRDAPQPAPEPVVEENALLDTQMEASEEAIATERPELDAEESQAFAEIARTLEGVGDGADAPVRLTFAAPEEDLLRPPAPDNDVAQDAPPGAPVGAPLFAVDAGSAMNVLEALPTPLLVHRFGAPLFANRAFLTLIGARDLADVAQRGVDTLFVADSEGRLHLHNATSDPVDVNLRTIPWDGEFATLLLLQRSAGTAPEPVRPAAIAEERDADFAPGDLRRVLESAADGTLMLDRSGRILAADGPAERLFGYEAAELRGRSLTLILAADELVLAALERLDAPAAEPAIVEATGITRRGMRVPLSLRLAALEENGRFSAVLHDLSAQKCTEAELRTARAQAQNANAQKADFLARVSHEVRTPLNAILGFAELMMEERFGPVGSERYRDYLRDIHASGSHIIGLVNDLLDLSKIEAGRLDLEPEDLALNELVQKVVAQHQPEANRNRVIVRTSLAQRLPLVSADQRVLRQVMETLLVNAVRATPAGGQVIVSTALDDFGQAVLRFRDSGSGMTEAEIAAALEPFRDLSDNAVAHGGGIGLPLAKALAEANKAHFSMKGTVGVGTLVELAFAPVSRRDPDVVLEMSRQR